MTLGKVYKEPFRLIISLELNKNENLRDAFIITACYFLYDYHLLNWGPVH